MQREFLKRILWCLLGVYDNKDVLFIIEELLKIDGVNSKKLVDIYLDFEQLSVEKAVTDLKKVLVDLNIIVVENYEDIALCLGQAIAEDILDVKTTPYDGARKVERIINRFLFDLEVDFNRSKLGLLCDLVDSVNSIENHALLVKDQGLISEAEYDQLHYSNVEENDKILDIADKLKNLTLNCLRLDKYFL